MSEVCARKYGPKLITVAAVLLLCIILPTAVPAAQTGIVTVPAGPFKGGDKIAIIWMIPGNLTGNVVFSDGTHTVDLGLWLSGDEWTVPSDVTSDNCSFTVTGDITGDTGISSTFTVDNTAPEPGSIDPNVPPAATNSHPIEVMYSGAADDPAAGNTGLDHVELWYKLGTGDWKNSGLTSSSADGTFNFNPADGEGVYHFALVAEDKAGNRSAAPAGNGDAQTDYDITPPTVTIGAPSATIAKSGPVFYSVTFSEPVYGVGASDFNINTTGTANGTVNITVVDSAHYTVTVSNITGDGTLGISVKAGGAMDAAGNGNEASDPSSTFDVDSTAPTVSIGVPSASITKSGPVTYAVKFSEDVTGFAANDITLNKVGSANGSVAVSAISATDYTVTISNVTGNGTLGITIKGNAAQDAAGNGSVINGPSNTFSVDNIAPTVEISAPSANPTTNGPISYSVTFSENVTGFASGDVTLNKTGTADGSVVVTAVNGTDYTVTISNITGSGALGITINAAAAQDAAGNGNDASAPSATFDVDNTRPTAAISAPSASITKSGPVTYTVTFSEPVTGFDESGVIVDAAGSVNRTVGVTGSGTTYTVEFSNLSGNGALGITIKADAARDEVGNGSEVSAASAVFTIDNTAPSVAISAPSTSLTKGGPVSYAVTFSEPVTGFIAADVALNKTGTANGIVNVTAIDSTRYTVTISSITGDGAIGITVNAAAAQDAAGNVSTASAPSATFTVDNTKPTVAVSAPSITATTSGPVSYTITFSEPVTGFVANDVALNAAGTANATVGVTGSGTSYTVTLSSITGNGSLGISVKADAAQDSAGNTNTASASSATFTISSNSDSIAPVAAINIQVRKTAGGSFAAIDEPIIWKNRTGYSYRIYFTATDANIHDYSIQCIYSGNPVAKVIKTGTTNAGAGSYVDIDPAILTDSDNCSFKITVADNAGNVSSATATHPHTAGTAAALDSVFGAYDFSNLRAPVVKILTPPGNGVVYVSGMKVTIKTQFAMNVFHVPGAPSMAYKADDTLYWMASAARTFIPVLNEYTVASASTGIPKTRHATLALPAATAWKWSTKNTAASGVVGLADRAIAYEWTQDITLIKGKADPKHPDWIPVDPKYAYQVELPYASLANVAGQVQANKPGPVPSTEPLGAYLLQREFTRFWVWAR